MFHITMTTQNYVLSVKQDPEQNGNPDLHVRLEYVKMKESETGAVTEAVITADNLIEWIIGQILRAEFIGNTPGVTII